MDFSLPEGDKQGKQQLNRKNAKRKVEAIDKAGNESIHEKSVKVQQVLDLIKHLGLTEEELSRLRKNLSDRNHRAHTKAEKEGYKTLAELRAKDVEQMLEMYNSFKAEKEKFKDVNKKMKAENKEMEAKIWKLQKEMEDLKKVTAANQMQYSDDQLGIGILDVPHGGFMIQDPMNMGNRIHGNPQPQGGPLNQYPMNMGNQMQIMPPVRANQHVGFGMGQTPISDFEMMQRQLQLPVVRMGNQHTGTESQGFGMEQNPISSFSATPSTSGVMQAREEFEIIQRQCQMSEGQFWPGTYEKGGTSAETAPNSQGPWKFP